MSKEAMMKCKCIECGKIFDYETSDLDEEDFDALLFFRNEDGLLETLCPECAGKAFWFGACKP